jgi:2-methylcitrate dehydratase PrpD
MLEHARQVARLAVTVREQGLESALLEDAARRVLDVVGNALAASSEEPARIAKAVADEWGGPPIATAIGVGGRYPAASAALINGALAHALDFDDTHLPSVLHPSSSVVPAALAAAEATGATGADLLAAITVGDEICVRLGMAGYDEKLGNSIFFERGQHATSICGAVGAAVAVAMLWGLDEERIMSALAIAASMGSGLLEANRTGGTVKRVHCGWAAHCATAAVDLARHGLTGPPTVLEGRFGFFQAWCGDDADPEFVVRRLGEHWDVPNVFFKPYPCNHFTHAGIDAALQLRAQGLRPEEVVALELGAPAPVLRTIAEPPELKASPPSGYAAAFSGPYTVAAALLGGGGLGVWLDDFTDAAAHDPLRVALATKVRCFADPEATRIFPHQLPAVLTAHTASGRTFMHRVQFNRGGPQHPLSADELLQKFMLGASRVLPDSAAHDLGERILGLAKADAVDEVLEASNIQAAQV